MAKSNFIVYAAQAMSILNAALIFSTEHYATVLNLNLICMLFKWDIYLL